MMVLIEMMMMIT